MAKKRDDGSQPPDGGSDPETMEAHLEQVTAERDQAISQLLGLHTELAQYRSIISDLAEMSRDGVLLASMEESGPIPLAVNSAFLNIIGIDGHQLEAHPESLGELLPPDWVAQWRDALCDGQPAHREFHSTRTDRWVDASCYPLKAHAVVVLLHDVTDVRHQLDRLGEENRLLRMVVENSSDLIFMTSGAGKITWIAPSAEGLLGYRPDEMIGLAYLDFVHPEDRSSASGAVSSLSPIITRLMRRDGGEILFALRLAKPDGESGRAVVGTTSRAGPAAAPADGLMEHTFATMADPHVLLAPVLSDDGRVVDFTYLAANDAACRWIDRPRSEVVGQQLGVLYPHLDPARLMLYVDTVRTGQPVSLDDVLDPEALDPADAARIDLRIARVDGALSVTWRDVSPRYAAHRDLELRETTLEQVMEGSPVAQALLSLDGVITSSNTAFSSLVDRHQRWLIGKSLTQVAVPGDTRAIHDDLERLVEDRLQGLDTTYSLLSGEGRPRSARVLLTTVYDHSAPVAIACYAQPLDFPAASSNRIQSLTDREFHVLEALAQGMENSAIAEEMFLSVKAVENHVSSIFRKLELNEVPGVNRRVRAALEFERSVVRQGSPRPRR